ncbi:DUF488 domain-containing protein [Brevundimonas diminuta]|uniref:DUF488 domain-containing protein n=1 Tax=Brevundimonas diminuta TaxID=293 RepID=UPI004057DE55
MKLFTIGYEGAMQAQVIDRLKAAGVELVADVRAVASSRIAGFSKTVLGESLKAEGLDYLQLRALGTPKAGRDAARKGDVATMRAVFSAHMQEPDAGGRLPATAPRGGRTARRPAVLRGRRLRLPPLHPRGPAGARGRGGGDEPLGDLTDAPPPDRPSCW